MPAIVALGRRWHVASDDLVLPCLAGTLFFATWTGLLAAAQARNARGSYCATTPFTNYVTSMLAFSAASCVLHALLAWQSNLGSMLDEARRRWVPWLLYPIGALYGGMLGLIIWGTVLIAQSLDISDKGCSGQGQWAAVARTVVFGSWAAIGLVFLCVLCVFNTFPSHSSPSAWVWRCTCLLCLCCSLDGTFTMTKGLRNRGGRVNKLEAADCEEGGGKQGLVASSDGGLTAQEQLGLTCHALFGHETLTLSDYLLGLVLLGTKHRLKREATRASEKPPEHPGSHQSIREATRASEKPPEHAAGAQAGGVVGNLLLGELPEVAHTGQSASKSETCVTVQAKGAGGTARAGNQEEKPNQIEPLASVHLPLIRTGAGGCVLAADGGGPTAAGAEGSEAAASAAIVKEGDATAAADPRPQDLDRKGSLGSKGVAIGTGAPAVGVEQLGSQQQEVPTAVLEAAAHYKTFALGPFGWPMYTFMHRNSVADGLCSLACGQGCSCLHSYHSSRVLPPILCGGWWKCMGVRRRLNQEALVRLAGLRHEDVVMFSDSNQVAGLLPYTVVLDHKYREVVLAVRGSMSMADVLTDTFWQPADLTEVLRSCGMCLPPPGPVSMSRSNEKVMVEDALACHEGILMSSIAIKNHLELHQVLKTALERGRQRDMELQQQQGSSAGDYKLVITGHSLGAGVAGVLGLLLRPSYPDLRVWSHAPPGGTLSPKAAKLTRDFCVAIVHAKDMIPRLNTSNLQLMLRDMINVGALCKRSKTEVLIRSLFGKRWTEEELFYASWDDVPIGVKNILEGYQRALKESQNDLPPEWELAGTFVPPGRVLFLEDYREPVQSGRKVRAPSLNSNQSSRQTGKEYSVLQNNLSAHDAIATEAQCSQCCCSKVAAGGGEAPGVLSNHNISRQQFKRQSQRRYIARYVPVETIVRGGLMVSGSMLGDHMPDKQLKSLKSCYQVQSSV